MVYKWYILPIGGLYATYHLLGEPETTIDLSIPKQFRFRNYCEIQVQPIHASTASTDSLFPMSDALFSFVKRGKASYFAQNWEEFLVWMNRNPLSGILIKTCDLWVNPLKPLKNYNLAKDKKFILQGLTWVYIYIIYIYHRCSVSLAQILPTTWHFSVR